MTTNLPSPAEVVIAGGGVAAVETVIGLRELAGDRVRITLVAPNADFVHRPMQVTEPFDVGKARRRPLRLITSDFDARFIQAAVTAVDAAEHRVVCASGAKLHYDALVLAPGGRAMPVFEGGITFGAPGAGAAMRDLLGELERGAVRRVGFVAPTLTGWGLPLYELALMTSDWLRARHIDTARVQLITPEERPLAAFGDGASAEVARLLAAAGVEFVGSTYADLRGDRLFNQAGRALGVDRVVTLPLIRGPELPGVPAEREYGFIPVDRHGRVTGLADVYAAGDATDFPVKQGGLAAQQADAVAEHIAARAGAAVQPVPFRPVLQGLLVTGGPEPADKIAGRFLAPYLARQLAAEGRDRGRAQPPHVQLPLEGRLL